MDAVVVIKKAQHQQTNAFALLQNININPREMLMFLLKVQLKSHKKNCRGRENGELAHRYII